MPSKSHSNKQKRRGVYYTPQEMTEVLCGWAIRSRSDAVLEPSFGGCGFVAASIKRLKSLNARQPKIFGCDIDKTAFRHLAKTIGRKSSPHQFIKADFLTVSPDNFSEKAFDVVLGNPPYVSYHNMFGKQRNAAAAAMKSGELILPKTASLWAHFVAHSLRFLRVQGRMAWLLPSSLLYSEYARILLRHAEKEFRRVVVISIGERLFLSRGTEERTEVLLCDGWKCGPAKGGVEIGYAQSLGEMRTLATRLTEESWNGVPLNGRTGYAFMGTEGRTLFEKIAAGSDILRLRDLAQVAIGIVTGANSFFIINRSIAKSENLSPRCLRPILSKFGIAKGLKLTDSDLQSAADDDQRCMLLNTAKKAIVTGRAGKYLSKFPAALRGQNATFKKRKYWHHPDDDRAPDAFFPYMNHLGPRLLLNGTDATCTNTIHRVFFKEIIETKQRRLAAISILSTFSQLSAEIEGRSYGSGVLKYEPSEASSVMLLMPKNVSRGHIERTLAEIDSLLRHKLYDKARRVADDLVFAHLGSARRTELVKKLEVELAAARRRRYGIKTYHNRTLSSAGLGQPSCI
jgi:adenine-specific DNA methylase